MGFLNDLCHKSLHSHYTEHMYLILLVASEILMNGFEIDYWNVWKVVSQVPH